MSGPAAGRTAEALDAQTTRNLALLRRGWAAFNEGDFEAAVEQLHPAGEVTPAVDDGRGPLRGRQELLGYCRRLADAWERVTVELRELTVAPDARILAVESWRVRGADGLDLETQVLDLYEFRDGLVFRVEGFLDRERALEALGRPDATPGGRRRRMPPRRRGR